MAEIKPFKGMRYNPEKISDISKVMAPPYDVISKEGQKELSKASPYNIVKIILGQEEGLNPEKYQAAAGYLNDWYKDSIIKADDRPSIYIYEQEFALGKAIKKRLGFIAAIKLEDIGEGLIYPHEKTMQEPKEDRLNLTRATKANLSPIFSLYASNHHEIEKILLSETKEPPLVEVVDLTGVRNKLWQLSDPQKIQAIAEEMKNKEIFIADGHHRYETALAYRDEREAQNTSTNGEEPFNYAMMMFVDLDDQGVVIFPAHRVVKLNILKEELIGKLKASFIVTPVNQNSRLTALLNRMETEKERHVFGLYLGANNYYFLEAKDNKEEIDVIILHAQVFERILGIGNEQIERFVSFTSDADAAVNITDKDTDKVTFFVNSTPIDAVKRMAKKGQIMPQKSTYFYPKLLTGLVIRRLEETRDS